MIFGTKSQWWGLVFFAILRLCKKHDSRPEDDEKRKGKMKCDKSTSELLQQNDAGRNAGDPRNGRAVSGSQFLCG